MNFQGFGGGALLAECVSSSGKSVNGQWSDSRSSTDLCLATASAPGSTAQSGRRAASGSSPRLLPRVAGSVYRATRWCLSSYRVSC